VTDSSLADRLRLYLVADPDQCPGDPYETIAAALRGGVTAVQLRWKTSSDREVLHFAQSIASLCKRHGALFLLNDRVDLAIAAMADGVHLGVDDLPLMFARQMVGPHFLIGYSPETDEQAQSARESGANYLGVGPVYGTASKSDAGPAIGLDAIARRVALAGIPTIGIGGISAANALPVLEAGAVGVAVVSAILKASDPERAARDLSGALGT
jgi:thiamine-phosphate pyrophosphorylase